MYPIKCIMSVLEGLISDPYGNYVLDLLFDLVLQLYWGQVLMKVLREPLPRLGSGLLCDSDAQTPVML
jgi:hypothetical protein